MGDSAPVVILSLTPHWDTTSGWVFHVPMLPGQQARAKCLQPSVGGPVGANSRFGIWERRSRAAPYRNASIPMDMGQPADEEGRNLTAEGGTSRVEKLALRRTHAGWRCRARS